QRWTWRLLARVGRLAVGSGIRNLEKTPVTRVNELLCVLGLAGSRWAIQQNVEPFAAVFLSALQIPGQQLGVFFQVREIVQGEPAFVRAVQDLSAQFLVLRERIQNHASQLAKQDEFACKWFIVVIDLDETGGWQGPVSAQRRQDVVLVRDGGK